MDIDKYCKKCDRNCCERLKPLVPRADRDRIVASTGKDFFTEEKGYYILSNPCAFLVEGRCSIYDIRPHDCRVYPYLNDLDGEVGLDDVNCPAGKSLSKDEIESPRESLKFMAENLTDDQLIDYHAKFGKIFESIVNVRQKKN